MPEDVGAPVLVVGAGPVGLAAALALRSFSLPATVLEAEPEDRIRPGSRALFVHRESLLLLEAACPGLGAELARHGVVWPTRRTFYRGRQVYAKTYPPLPAAEMPPFTSLRQAETERHLRTACKAAGVDFVWSAEVCEVRAGATGVTVLTVDGRSWRAGYVIGADGARSAVRRSLGIGMRGSRSGGFHVVVDVDDDSADPMPLERVYHYRHPGVGGRNVMRVPFAGGFQIDLQCRPDDRAEDFGTAEALRRWFPGVVDRRYLDAVRWASTYRYLQVVAESFVDEHRRVLLVGEAAHLFPPLGARGMNSGIADADVAATAIRLALAGRNPKRSRAAIDRFDEARRAAARFNSDAAGTALAHLTPDRAGTRLRQRAAAALSPVVPRFGEWLEHAAYGPRGGPPAASSRRY
jgi:3-(3-hydroxy-phenyl)propionate hydroxylase